MHYSSLVQRIAGEGAAAWDLHYRAIEDKRAGRDVIVLSQGDPDFDTPAAIQDAAIAALRAGETHYTDMLGIPDLRQAIAERHRLRSGQAVGPGNVAVVSGAQCGLFIAAQCLVGSGDDVAVLEPMYVTYEATIRSTGATLVRVPQRPANDFHLNPADLAAAITSSTRAIFFATPSNRPAR
jgi:aspartate/methionine/tyrosine aminotransferase